MSDAVFPLFFAASLSLPDPVRNLIRRQKIIRLHEAAILLMRELRDQPLHIGPHVEPIVDSSLSKRIHRTAHVSALPRVCKEPVLSTDHERFHSFTLCRLSSIRHRHNERNVFCMQRKCSQWPDSWEPIHQAAVFSKGNILAIAIVCS